MFMVHVVVYCGPPSENCPLGQVWHEVRSEQNRKATGTTFGGAYGFESPGEHWISKVFN